MPQRGSVDRRTVEGFGYEWTKFDQSGVSASERENVFQHYFALFPWDSLPPNARGFDLGCGSGRWARLVAERTGTLLCVEASADALRVASANAPGCPPMLAFAGALPLRPASMDFGYSLGVLHHIPEPISGLADAVTVLKPGAPFLVYLYYAFDNRAPWFRTVWRASELLRRAISRCPHVVRYGISGLLAAFVYLPLATLSKILVRRGKPIDSVPLSSYWNRSFYTMRNDALDRFGTRLEQRFTQLEVHKLMAASGLERVVVSDEWPYWCAVGYKPCS